MFIMLERVSGPYHENIGMQVIDDLLQPDPAHIEHESQHHHAEHYQHHGDTQPGNTAADMLNKSL